MYVCHEFEDLPTGGWGWVSDGSVGVGVVPNSAKRCAGRAKVSELALLPVLQESARCKGDFFDHAPKGDRRALSSFEQKNPPYGKKVCQSHLRVIALPSKSGEYQKNPPCIAQIPVYWSLLILLSFARSILVPSGLSVPSWSLPFSGPCCTC